MTVEKSSMEGRLVDSSSEGMFLLNYICEAA